MVGVGDKRSAYGAHIFPSGHFLLLPHTECLVYLGRCVAQQCERQRVFVGKFLSVAQRACFCGASRSVVFGIKVNYQRLAFEIAFLYHVAFGINPKVGRYHIAYIHCMWFLCRER